MSEIQYFDPRGEDTMPGLRDLVSFTRTPYLATDGFSIPLTSIGVHLQGMAQGGAPEFLLHEFGSRIIYPNWNAQGVLSPFWRLYHNTDSGAVVWHDGREILLEPNKIWLISENTRFDCRAMKPVNHMWIHFTLRPAYAFDVKEPFSIEVDAGLTALLASLRDEPLPVLNETDLRRLYFGCMALIHSTFARANLTAAKPLPPVLREVLRKIERSPRENLSNERLAKLCGLSVGGFTRLFAQHMDLSPAIYVRRTRLNYASRLLAFTEMSIEQIADETGFPNRHYFTRMFVRHAGCGPATFRKTHQSGNISSE
jgi:AraC family transcriptional regulator of arabinose operon